jgi:hypothetical protein
LDKPRQIGLLRHGSVGHNELYLDKVGCERCHLLKILTPVRIIFMLASSSRYSSTKVIKEEAKFISYCFY